MKLNWKQELPEGWGRGIQKPPWGCVDIFWNVVIVLLLLLPQWSYMKKQFLTGMASIEILQSWPISSRHDFTIVLHTCIWSMSSPDKDKQCMLLKCCDNVI